MHAPPVSGGVMLVVLVYLFRARVLDVIERQFDILTITRFVIDLLSVPVTRIIVGTGFFAVLLAVAAGTRRLRPVLAYMAICRGSLRSRLPGIRNYHAVDFRGKLFASSGWP